MMQKILTLLSTLSLMLFASCDRNAGIPGIPDPNDTVTNVLTSDTLYIVFEMDNARVTNSDTIEGVSINIQGSEVVVRSTTKRALSYVLTGASDDGSFKIYSEKSFNLILSNLTLCNPDGPAINNQSSKAAEITLADGTENMLSDGSDYAVAPTVNGIAEDQGATFFSEGQLIFNGSGTLHISSNGLLQHGLNSDDFILIKDGTIVIDGAKRDGIHANDGFTMSGGTVSIVSGSDGIDGGLGNIRIRGGEITLNNESPNVNGLCCDSSIYVTGGEITATLTGNQSKGLKSTQNMYLDGGQISIDARGGAVLLPLRVGYNPSYCTAIKSDADIVVDSATINIIHSGIAGKGISSSGSFTMKGGNVSISTSGGGNLYTNSMNATDAYSATCISTNGRVDILGGNLSVTSTGIGGKGISADGILTIGSLTGSPTVIAATSGNSILSGTTSVTESKALKSDEDIYLVNGTVLINTTGAGEGIDTKKGLFMEGGTVIVQGSAVEKTKSIDYGTSFAITGGTLMVSGPKRSTIPTPSAAGSTQRWLFSTCIATVSAGTLFHIQDAGATDLVTYKPTRTAYYFIFSSPNLSPNTAYQIFTGGTTTGVSTNGLFSSGIYTPGTLRATFGTTTNTITF